MVERRFQAFENYRSVPQSVCYWLWEPRWRDLWPLVRSSRVSFQLSWVLQQVWMWLLGLRMYPIWDLFAYSVATSFRTSLKTIETFWNFWFSRTLSNALCQHWDIQRDNQLYHRQAARNCPNPSVSDSWSFTWDFHSFASVWSISKTWLERTHPLIDFSYIKSQLKQCCFLEI